MHKGIIIGGGIAGLTTALALQQLGVTIKVFECAPEIKPVGAGIWMAPNAMQVFHRLGIAHKVNAGGVPLQKIEVVDRYMKPVLSTNQRQIRETFGYTTTAIKRSVLQDLLLSEVGAEHVILNKTCISIAEEKGGLAVTFADGSVEHADYIIAADGIHSAIRNKLFPGVALRSTGHACWRGMAKLELKPAFKKAIIESWANGYRFGFSEVADGVVDWFAVQKDHAAIPKDTGLKDSLLSVFKDFAYPVTDILAATEEAKIIKHELIDFVPLKKWSRGKICLIGDAAHASTPYMGQGGCQAIEDAYVVAQCLHRHQHIEAGFEQLQQIRRAKATSVVNLSRMMGTIGYMKNNMGSLRDFLIRATPQLITQQQFCKVYKLNF